MVGLLTSLYMAIHAKYAARSRYLNAKLAQVHLTGDLKPRMSAAEINRFHQQDTQLRIAGEQQFAIYQRACDWENEIKAMMTREERSKDYSNALWTLG